MKKRHWTTGMGCFLKMLDYKFKEKGGSLVKVSNGFHPARLAAAAVRCKIQR